jgi:hypothetical protein
MGQAMTDRSLATRPLTDQQILTRIELLQKGNYGLERANQSQLNLCFLICQKLDVIPGEDLTLYDGKPWLTVDGRVKLMRRHPEYRGYTARPLTKAEKEAWGYEPDDIVVEVTIRTNRWGEIAARGKVTRAEIDGKQQRGNPVARLHPVEMAEKRAISRAERLAFGTDALIGDDEAEDLARAVVTERSEPARVRELAARQTEIFGTEDASFFDPSHRPGSSAPAPETPTETPEPEPPEPEVTERIAEGEQAGRLMAQLEEDADINGDSETPFIFNCSECGNQIMAQDGEPINANQADLIRDRFGKLVCRDHRPVRATKAKAS